MIRQIIFLSACLVLFGSCNLKKVNNNIALNDSIQKNLKKGNNLKLHKSIRKKYNDKAFSMINLDKNDTLTRFYLSCLSLNYLNLNNDTLLKKASKLLYNKSKEANDTLNLARYYRYRAGYYKINAIDDSAFYYYLKAEKFYKKTKDGLGLAIVYSNKRQLQYRYDDYIGSNLSAKKAYRYYKNSNNLEGQYHSLIAIGNNCTILKEYNNAIIAFQKALEILKKDKSIDNSGICLNDLGNVYREQKKFRKAMYYLNLALKDKSLITTNPSLVGFLLNNLSFCRLQLKDYSGVPEMLYKSLQLMKDAEGSKEKTITYIYLSNYFMAVHDTLKSQICAEKALKIAKEYHAPYYYLTALSNAGSVDEKKAPKYIVEYHKINDSLFFLKNNAINQYYTIQLETDDIKQEKEAAVLQKWIVTGTSLVVILVIILLLIITKQRSKQKELRLLQEQQKNNEEIYNLMLSQKSKEEHARQSEKKRIALELHDGVMNKLASTRLNLNVLKHKNDGETIEKCLKHIAGIYDIEQEIRSISHDLTLDEFNNSINSFVILIKDFIKTQIDITTTKYKLEMDDTINWEMISSVIKMNLFRIIQEASHNINKFAQAKNAVICFILDTDNICVSIIDDGKGFDTEINSEGIGLKNIKQRVESLNGKLLIQSINNKRTSLNIAIPFG